MMNETQLNIQQQKINKKSQLEKSTNILLQKHDEYDRTKTQCNKCRLNTPSIMRRVPQTLTWLWCAFTLTCTLCMIPFYLKQCNRQQIYCAQCFQLKSQKNSECCKFDCRCCC